VTPRKVWERVTPLRRALIIVGIVELLCDLVWLILLLTNAPEIPTKAFNIAALVGLVAVVTLAVLQFRKALKPPGRES
jgi:hypothetical protein